MSNILENIRNFFMIYRSLDPLMWVSTVVEILLIAFVIYKFLAWIKNTRAWSLLRGIGVITFFVIVSYVFQFSVILWILQNISGIAVIAIVIIFQDEIRPSQTARTSAEVAVQLSGATPEGSSP